MIGYQATRLHLFGPLNENEMNPNYRHQELLRGYTDDEGQKREGMPRREIVRFDTPFLAQAMRLFADWKRFKVLPHGGGTLEERQTTLEILTILDAEAIQFDEWEREKTRQEAKSRKHGKRP